MAKDRAKDTRRSVGSHENMMGALGRAAGWTREVPTKAGGSRVSSKVNEETGEVFLAVPGKAHVYNPKEAKNISERYK